MWGWDFYRKKNKRRGGDYLRNKRGGGNIRTINRERWGENCTFSSTGSSTSSWKKVNGSDR